MTLRSARALLIGMTLLLGCGGTPAGNDAGTSPDTAAADPLIGTWFLQVTTGAENQTVTMTLAAGGAMTFVHSQQDAATASDHAGCLDVVSESGTYTASGGTLTLTSVPAMSQQTYSGCAAATDDGTVAYTGTPFTPASPATYTVVGNTLTLSGSGLNVMFTRR